ncbi:MAG: methyltransferase domain-containing protein [Gammaproteobacteria bacterium]
MTEGRNGIDRDSIRTMMQEGASLFDQGRFDEARQLFEEAGSKDAAYPEAPHMLGLVALYTGDFSTAVSKLERAIKLAPDRGDFHQNLGQVYHAVGQPQRAMDSWREAIRLERDNTAARELLAQTQFDMGEFAAAVETYSEILELDNANLLARHNISHALHRAPYVDYSVENEKALLAYLDFSNTEHNYLLASIAGVLADKYGWSKENFGVEPNKIAGDILLIKTLNTVYVTEPVFEKVLTLLRRKLLFIDDAEKGKPYEQLVAALALQSVLNEFVFAVDSEEQGIIRDLEKKASDLEPWGLLRLAMYEPFAKQSCVDSLKNRTPYQFPEVLENLLVATLDQDSRELALAKSVDSFGSAANAKPKAVQKMYEENPYPRWTTLGHVAAVPLAAILHEEIPGFVAPSFTDGRDFSLLIAGCGTGRHALRGALGYLGADVLAVDLSRRSLGYAQRKATDLGVSNITFQQTNIFDLPKLSKKFEVIETIGTLETLDDPAEGWTALRQCLEPNGLLHVGAYSELSRRPVITAREKIAELGLKTTPGDMRQFRGLVMDGKLGEAGDALLTNGDFYSLSGIRDFLFHVSESRFYVKDIKRFLNENQLKFVGFTQHPVALLKLYRDQYPQDTTMNNLDNWIELEEQHADSVAQIMNLRMYYFWCQAV